MNGKGPNKDIELMEEFSRRKSAMKKANIAIALIFFIFAATRIVRVLGLRIVTGENGIAVKLHPHFHGTDNTSPLNTND